MKLHLALTVTAAIGITACTSSAAADPTVTAPVPTTAAPFTAAPVTTTVPETTVPETTVPETTVPATTVPTGPVAVGGDPFLTDIPGQMIDYVPDVAANLDIDVPGQYYELIPKVYVFIPVQASTTNASIQPPVPADKPILEAFARATAAVMSLYTSNPTPADGSPEMKAAFTKAGYAQYEPSIADQVAGGYHTEVRTGYILMPRVVDGTRTKTSALVLDCSWLDQKDVNSDGTIHQEWNEPYPGASELVLEGDTWLVDSAIEDNQGCA